MATRPLRFVATCGAVASIALLPGPLWADEVDDLLALKARPMERVKRFSTEIVTSTEASQGGTSKTLTSRQRITLERGAAGDARQWKLEVEAFEPRPMKMRKDGDRMEIQGPDGEWKEVALPPQMKEQLTVLGHQFTGTDPASVRRNFAVRIVRHNHPLFGPTTTTLEMVPQGQLKLFAKMHEDIAEDGLVVATRMYNGEGRETMSMNVTKRTHVVGVPVASETEISVEGPRGSVKTTMMLRDVQVDTR